MLALKVGTLSTTLELVTIVLVAHLQMIKRVQQSLDFLLTLLDLAVKFITITLQLFLLLRCLDDIVSLRVLTLSLYFSRTRLIALNEALVLNTKVLHLVVALLELNLDLMALLLSSLEFTDQDVLVDLDLLLTLLHRHLKLILAILKTVDFVSALVDLLTQALNLKLHDVMLNKSLLLALNDVFEIAASHLVLELKLTDDRVKLLLVLLGLSDHSVDVAALILKLLVRGCQKLEVLLSPLLVFRKSIDLLLQLGFFFLRSDALHAINASLHLLDLEVLRVDELLLALLLNLQLRDVCLQVARGRESTGDITDEVGLLSSELEKRLRLLEEDFFLVSDLLLNLGHHRL